MLMTLSPQHHQLLHMIIILSFHRSYQAHFDGGLY